MAKASNIPHPPAPGMPVPDATLLQHGAWREGTVEKVCVRPKVPWLGVQIVGVSAHSGKMLHDFAEFSEEPGIFIL